MVAGWLLHYQVLFDVTVVRNRRKQRENTSSRVLVGKPVSKWPSLCDMNIPTSKGIVQRQVLYFPTFIILEIRSEKFEMDVEWSKWYLISLTLMQKNTRSRTALVVQWLKLHAFNAGSTGSIPDWGTEISHMPCGKKKNRNMRLLWTLSVWTPCLYSWEITDHGNFCLVDSLPTVSWFDSWAVSYASLSNFLGGDLFWTWKLHYWDSNSLLMSEIFYEAVGKEEIHHTVI